MKNFNKKLIEWYSEHKRNLPWKNNSDPYQIWLSEIILQQTRTEQGLPYYLKFVGKYPTIIDFANTGLDEILKTWEGLGYYSRARNMHITAKNIRDNFHGVFPKTYEEIRKLKGVGDYTAAAIASFAYQLPYAVLDGNVFRFLSRYFGQDIPIDTSEGKKYFQNKAQELLNKHDAASHNQAMMDFGAMVCTPVNPKCTVCPFASECVAFNQNKIDSLPVKSKKLIKKERFIHYFVFKDTEQIIIKQRTDNDIWKLLFDFPSIETNGDLIENQQLEVLKKSIKLPKPYIFKQILTHQKINAYFYEFDSFRNIKDKATYQRVHFSEIKNYAFPKIITDYLKNK